MKESVNSSGVPTTQLASSMWFADVTGKAAQFAYENYMKIAYLDTRLAVKDITKFSRGRKIIT